jgi:hypothetical protein
MGQQMDRSVCLQGGWKKVHRAAAAAAAPKDPPPTLRTLRVRSHPALPPGVRDDDGDDDPDDEDAEEMRRGGFRGARAEVVLFPRKV